MSGTKETLIKNVNLVDVNEGAIKEKQDILISNGKIIDIGPSLVGTMTGEHIIDGNNSFAMPGMADLHVHLNWDGSKDPKSTLAIEGTKIGILRAYKNALDHLKMGITSLLDVGSMDDLAIDLASAIRKGVIFGPDLYATGRIICIIGGHGAGLGYEISGKDDALRATRNLIKNGADLLKISATSGAYGSYGAEKLESIQLDPEEIRTITSEASKYKIKVTAHALNLEGIKNCIENGVEVVHHGAFMDKDTARRMAQKGIVYVPTLLVYKKLAEDVPGVMPEAIAKAKEVAKHHKEAFLNAIDAGVKIAGGTDAYSPNFGDIPRLIDEAILMSEYGMANIDVLRSITINAAKVLGNENRTGTLEIGKDANLVFLKNDPIKDVRNLTQLRQVIFKGREVYG